MPVFEYRIATDADLECIWNKDIIKNSNNKRYKRWKKEYINYNKKNFAKTFVVIADGEPVGQGTLLFSPSCKAVGNRLLLADNNKTANINALRIEKKYEGKGHISKLISIMEHYAINNGYSALTIGVEDDEKEQKRYIYILGIINFCSVILKTVLLFCIFVKI